MESNREYPFESFLDSEIDYILEKSFPNLELTEKQRENIIEAVAINDFLNEKIWEAIEEAIEEETGAEGE